MKEKWVASGLITLAVAALFAWNYHPPCLRTARELSGLTLTGALTVSSCHWSGADQVVILLQLDSAAAERAAVEAAQQQRFRRFEDLSTTRDSALFPDLVGKHGWVSDEVYRNLGGNRIILDLDKGA